MRPTRPAGRREEPVMGKQIRPWLPLLRERWLYLVLALSLLGVGLAYQRPVSYELDLGSPVDGIGLEGFYAPERGPSGPFRWTGEQADVRLSNLWPGQAVTLTLLLSAPRPEGQAPENADGTVPVQVSVNGRALDTLALGPNPREVALGLGNDLIGPEGDLYLELRAPAFSVPTDLRALAILFGGLSVRPQAGQQPPFLPPLETLLCVAAVAGLAYLWLRRLGAGVPPALGAGLLLALTATVGLLSVPGRLFVTPLGNRLLLLIVIAMLCSEVFARAGGLQPGGPADLVRPWRLAAALLFVAFAIRLALAITPGDHDNFLAFKMMIDNDTRNGIAQAYAIDPVIGAYPPVHHYLLALVGNLYRTFVSPEFDVASRRLNFVMKLPTIVLDMLITLTLMIYAARRRGARFALWVGAAYALNPGIIYTTSYNGQLGDPLYALFVTIAVAALLSGQGAMTGAATALAVLTKPQASAFLPFLALGALRHLPGKALGRAIVAGAAIAALALAPFAWAGTLSQMVHTVSTTIGHGPRIASEAHNLWWLWGWGQAWEIKDSQLMLGLVPYRTVGLVLFFGVAYGLIAWKLWTARRREGLALLAGFVGLAFFMLPTEIHENYLFPTIPLLVLAAVHDRRAWIMGAVLTVTWTLNLLIIDQTLVRPLLAAWPAFSSLVFPLRVATSAVNVGALLLWAWWLLNDDTESPSAVSRVNITVQ